MPQGHQFRRRQRRRPRQTSVAASVMPKPSLQSMPRFSQTNFCGAAGVVFRPTDLGAARPPPALALALGLGARCQVLVRILHSTGSLPVERSASLARETLRPEEAPVGEKGRGVG